MTEPSFYMHVYISKDVAAAFKQTAATKSLQYAAARKDVISQPPNISIE